MGLLRLSFTKSSCVLLVLLISGAVSAFRNLVKRQAPNVPPQNPPVFQALDQLRGSEPLSATQIQQILAYSYPGSSYPTYSYIPQTSFSCSQVRQFGFYADPETRCQVFRRCEANNYMFSYICPNGTVFNQITLICDWFYNVNCPSVGGFYDYSNPRIYRQDLKLFDDTYGGGYGSNSLSGGSGSYGMVGSNYGASGNQMYASGNNPVPAATALSAGGLTSTGSQGGTNAQYRLLPMVRSVGQLATTSENMNAAGQATDAAYR